MAATAGVADFNGCQIIGPAGSYTITATDTSDPTVASATSNPPFNITFGAPDQLAFTIQPGGGKNGAAWTTQPAVTIQDSGGNTVATSTDTITLAIASPLGNGATLTCTGGLSVAATAGVADFNGCQIIGPAGSYTITATDTSDPTVAEPPATHPSISPSVPPTSWPSPSNPAAAQNGAAWTTQPAVDHPGQRRQHRRHLHRHHHPGHRLPARQRRHPHLHRRPLRGRHQRRS